MKKKEPLLKLLLLSCATLSLSSVKLLGLNPPSCMIVEQEGKIESCYNIECISKLLFKKGELKVERKADEKQFTPKSIPLSRISKIYFTKEKNPNNDKKIIKDKKSSLSYTIYDNCLTIIGFTNIPTKLFLYSLSGLLVHKGNVSTSSYSIDISSLSSGVYFLYTSHSQILKISIL